MFRSPFRVSEEDVEPRRIILSYQPPPLLNIPRWYPLLRSAAARQDQDDLCTLYSLASTFTFILCRSIHNFSLQPLCTPDTLSSRFDRQRLDHFKSTLIRILFLRRHLLIIIHLRDALRLSRAWHAVVLHRLRTLKREFEVKQRIVAIGRLSTSIIALLGLAAWFTNREENLLPTSTALPTFTSILMAVATGITSTIGHGTHLHLPLFRIEDSMRTMKAIIMEAGLTCWIVSETLVNVEERVNNLQVQGSSLMNALCISLEIQNLEPSHSLLQYTESWKMFEKEVEDLERRVQRDRRRWERQGSGRYYQRLSSLFS